MPEFEYKGMVYVRPMGRGVILEDYDDPFNDLADVLNDVREREGGYPDGKGYIRLTFSALGENDEPPPADREALYRLQDTIKDIQAIIGGVPDGMTTADAVQARLSQDADRDALADALAQVWRLLERGANPGMAIEVIANALGVNESPKPTDRKYLSGTWMPGLRDLELRIVEKELVKWAADVDNAVALDNTYYCVFCGTSGMSGVTEHEDDCLHLRARALRGDDELTRGRIEEEE